MSFISRASDANYGVKAVVVSVNNVEPHDPRLWAPNPDDDGVAVLLRWTCAQTGRVLHVVVAAPVKTAPAVAMLDLQVGDEVLVAGSVECISWPGVFNDIAVMRMPRDIEIVSRAARGTAQQPDSAQGA